jgi:hypothetical protein
MALARGAEARFLRRQVTHTKIAKRGAFRLPAPEFTTKTHWRRGTEGSNPPPSSEESNANLMPTTFSQPAVRSLRNRLPIARSTKCPRNPSCVGRL